MPASLHPPIAPVRLRSLLSKRGFVLSLLLLLAGANERSHSAEPAVGVTLKVMTYNLRYASDKPPNAWEVRRPVAAAMLEELAPDLVGTQEGLYQQVKDLAADLPDYAWIGLGRDGGSRGEFMAIYYLRARFEPLEFDHFWLSDTPDRIGSSTWGNSNRRMVTWARFREHATSREFTFFNTHFDHELQPAREKSAALLWERLQAVPAETPVIVVGDFNAAAQRNPAYETLVGAERLTDAWLSAAERGPLLGTFHGYAGPRPKGPRIDWILTRGPVACRRAEIITYQRDGQYPSDHFPVVAELRLEGGGE
jgi:endonuclease/exonuclease/phosphatase family metal-dependent hydrolase